MTKRINDVMKQFNVSMIIGENCIYKDYDEFIQRQHANTINMQQKLQSHIELIHLSE